MRLGCLGMATLDTLLFVRTPAFASDAVTTVDDVVFSLGGKGLVSAIAMRHAGADVLPFALVGAESELPRTLPEDMDARNLQHMLDTDTRIWITVSDAQEVVTFVAVGQLRADQEAVNAAVERFVEEVDALYVTLEQAPVLRSALQEAKRRGLRIASNLSVPLLDLLRREDPGLLAALVSASEILFCNHGESPQVLSMLGADDWSEVEGPASREVVVTAGASGGRFNVAPFDHWESFEARPPSHLRCVVGAGDTFNGAYLVARLVEGASPGESCRRGADLAALKVSHRGSTLPLEIGS